MPFASVVVVPSTPPLVFSRVTITFGTPGSPASWNPSLFVSNHTRSPKAAVATGVFVGVAVGVLVGVAVGVLVGVAVGVFVGVAVGVFVGVGVGRFFTPASIVGLYSPLPKITATAAPVAGLASLSVASLPLASCDVNCAPAGALNTTVYGTPGIRFVNVYRPFASVSVVSVPVGVCKLTNWFGTPASPPSCAPF